MMTDRTSLTPRRRNNRRDVAVVGGGMVGAAAALALRQQGLDVLLIEARSPKPWCSQDPLDLRVVALAPSSVRLLNQLGVWQTIKAKRAQKYTHMYVWDSENGAQLEMDAAISGQDALGFIVENKLVQSVLWQALEEAGVSIKCPARVTHIEQDAHKASLALDTGEMVESRAVVAADGGNSPVRDMLGIAITDKAYHQRAVVAHVKPDEDHHNTAWQRFTKHGVLAMLPLPEGRVSVVWSLPEAEAHRVLALDDNDFLHELSLASDMRLGKVTQTTPRAAFPLHLRLVRHYQRERTVLLGDAAHTIHPMAGQGVNLGLRDVVELERVLGGAMARGQDVGRKDVLERYARRRLSANTIDARCLDWLGRVYQWQSMPLVGLRGVGMRTLNRLTVLKKGLTRHASGM